MRAIGWALVMAALNGHAADGLRLPGHEPDLRWQARAQGWAPSTDLAQAPRLLAPAVLGDYYLSASGQGLRLSGGLMAPVPRHDFRPGLRVEAPSHQPYLGVGYSNTGLGWGVSADLGIALQGAGLNLRRVDDSFAPSLNAPWRGVQLQPMVQMGLFYRF
ncbi:hypothetical protein [Inhella gelatinilytica]|uniref:Uncharacterized protein n=1 Tax=Inhella gelatinilytica TaxID=2795030 RepID=A0A931NAH0_9BURK|nr:hypothetical protein [Inhella gelatinilytica]MBH9552468.1 hypothetical protein [Inhella gelatinilytica]